MKRTIYTLLFLAVAIPSLLHAQSGGTPDFWLDGPSNAGTEFFLSFPANWEYAAGDKYVRLYIGAAVETEVRITAQNGLYEKIVRTVPNGIVQVDLANYVAQPFVRGDQAPVPDDQVYENQAVRIESGAPIIVSGINRTTATSDGILALPVSALGRHYIVASARSVASGAQQLPSQYVIVAPYDDTELKIWNSFSTPNHEEGEEVTVTLNSGDVYYANSVGFYGDLSGTEVIASKPVGVLGGQTCTYLPNENFPACDHIVEMLTPIESWGTYYHALPFQNRTKGDTYRVFAGAPDAKIYINGQLYATLPGVGGGDGYGWLEFREDQRRPLEFSSNKPIQVLQYNNSQTYDNSTSTDPFFMTLTPVEQYRTDLIFTTPSADFPLNYLTVVGDSIGMDQMEIAKAGSDNWQAIRSFPGSGGYRVFPTRYQEKGWSGIVLSMPPGVWQIRSPLPFAAYLYGGGNFDSYGYPAGITSAQFGTGDTTAPSLTLELDSCTGMITGSIRDGRLQEGPSSGISTIRLAPESRDYALETFEFNPGVDSSLTFRVTPSDTANQGSATVIVYDMAGNRIEQSVDWEKKGGALSWNVDTVDIGTVLTGSSRSGVVVITNESDSAVTLTDLHLSGDGSIVIDPDQAFTLPLVLQPGESREIRIILRGDVEGDHHALLYATTGCGEPVVHIIGRIDSDTDVEEEFTLPSELDLSNRAR